MSTTICPYCRNALTGASDVEACPLCDALHHQECWSENGGCAVLGCTGVAEEEALGRIVITEEDLTPASAVEAPSRSRRVPVINRTIVVAAILLVALAGFAAFLLKGLTQEEETGPSIEYGKTPARQVK